MEQNKRPTKDYWAADRTHMANQRTLLSWVRTAFMLLGSGITLMKLLPEDDPLFWVGTLLLPGSLVFLLLGLHFFIKMKRSIRSHDEKEELKS